MEHNVPIILILIYCYDCVPILYVHNADIHSTKCVCNGKAGLDILYGTVSIQINGYTKICCTKHSIRTN